MSDFLFTVGHSTMEAEALVAILQRAEIETLMDVRSHPGSARYPHFNRERMQQWVPAAGVAYTWEPRLGGWRDTHADFAPRLFPYGVDVAVYTHRAFPKQRIAQRIAEDGTQSPDCPTHGFNRRLYEGEQACTCPPGQPIWYVCGFYDYSFYMMLDEFLQGLADLSERVRAGERIAIMCQEGKWFSCHRSMIADAIWYVYGVDSVHLPGKKPHSAALGNRLERYHPDIRAAWDRVRRT